MKLNRRQLRRLINEALEDAMTYPASGITGEELMAGSNSAWRIVQAIVSDAGFDVTKLSIKAPTDGTRVSNMMPVFYSGEPVTNITVYGQVYPLGSGNASPEAEMVKRAIRDAFRSAGMDQSALHAEYGY